MKPNLDSTEYYINRELSWLEFNHRVLEEAMDSENPLLERFRFAAIVCSNLDEYFMVRVAALKRKIEEGRIHPDDSGMTPEECHNAVTARAHKMTTQLNETISKQLLPQAAENGIQIISYSDLNPVQKSFVDEKFETEIFPVLTPMAIDPSHPFPILLNLSLNIGLLLNPAPETETNRIAIVPIPAVFPRLYRLPDSKYQFVMIGQIVRNHLNRLFPGQTVLENVLFRITRDAELEFDDEGSSDHLKIVETELRKRRTNPVVRFEVESAVSKGTLKTFRDRVGAAEEEIFLHTAFVDPRFLMMLADLPGLDHLRNKPQPPLMLPEFENRESIWPIIREGDVVMHHPYESFEPVIQLVSQAADDPNVMAMKLTLYRTSGDSPIIRALMRAAASGKQVTVLVEVMARFDEERNIEWARELEKAGAHVIYGVAGLKTHAKILLIIRREKEGTQRYVHLSTGNYNDRTARAYSDIGLITSDEEIGSDASGFFNTITGYSDPPDFKKLRMAPLGLRERFLHLISRETERAKSGQHAAITAKMNSLVDGTIIRALYEASMAGVQIKLAIRGICCLRPGIKGVSERIQVVSIVDRFLEHSRIYYFQNGGDEEFYCSSADWMPRNLDKRVELLFPISSENGRKKLRDVFEFFFSDNLKARILQSEGSYHFKKRKKNEEIIRCQEAIYLNMIEQKETPQTLTFVPQTTPSG